MVRSCGRSAFTLVELLVVMAIVTVLTGLTLSAVQRVRAAAARTSCADRLRQLGLAAHHYHGTYGALPPGVTIGGTREPHRYMSWHTRLLPFVERADLWRQAEAAYGLRPDDFRAAPPHPIDVVVPPFVCPADPDTQQARAVGVLRVAYTDYLGVSGTRQTRRDGVLYVDSRTKLTDILDGTSQTLLAGERPPSADGALGWWYAGAGHTWDGSGDSVLSVGERPTAFRFGGCVLEPARFGPGDLRDQCSALHFWSLHPAGGHFLFCDGSARYVPYAAADLLPALATRAGGEAGEMP